MWRLIPFFSHIHISKILFLPLPIIDAVTDIKDWPGSCTEKCGVSNSIYTDTSCDKERKAPKGRSSSQIVNG